VYSGKRKLLKGQKITFEFSLLITPVKELDTARQFTERYYHNGGAPDPTMEDVQAGVKIVNVHHANKYNPHINYPFIAGKELKDFDVEIYGYDPLLTKEGIEGFGVKALNELNVKVDCVIVAVAHDEFKKMKLEDLTGMMNDKPVLIDVRGLFDEEEAERREVCYRRL